ncbi:MAG: FHA domain-containing protein [Pyrinomonadaceae bacterium]
MVEVTLTIHAPDGTSEVQVTGSSFSIGRDSEAAMLAINDSSLSRLHASINREGERVWILDENSTNGSLVNNVPVPPVGAPLTDGDEIVIGNTSIIVSFNRPVQAAHKYAQDVASPYQHQPITSTPQPFAPAAATEKSSLPVPVIVAIALIVVVVLAVAGIGSYAAWSSGKDDKPIVVQNRQRSNERSTENENKNEKNANGDAPVNASPAPDNRSGIDNSDDQTPNGTGGTTAAPAKRYAAMTQEEKMSYVAQESQHVARMIGNREGFAFTPEVVAKIKVYVDAYAIRLRTARTGGECHFPRDDLTTLLEHGRKQAPLIIKSFNEKGLSPQVGLYLAMIESEYCPCLSSGTGAKGMFQFVGTTARRYGVPDVSNPSTDRRFDDRCKAEIMAPIAALYVKDLIAMFGTGPLSVPLAIASYNSGEGGLSVNLFKALNAARNSSNPERSFWTLVANSEQMSDQFQRENIKYVPKFFGAAIVGENPRVFGVEMGPLSTYTQ